MTLGDFRHLDLPDDTIVDVRLIGFRPQRIEVIQTLFVLEEMIATRESEPRKMMVIRKTCGPMVVIV